MADGTETVELLRRVWTDLADIASDLSDDEWSAPTECPGWDVKDNISHIAGTESTLMGRPAPDHTPAKMDHVKNAIGKQNEVAVDFRRSWSPAEVVTDFDEVTSERLKILEGYGAGDWEKDSWTPAGPGSVLDFMQIRIFDSWVHEQDIRRAIGRPGNLDGPVAEHALGRCLMAMPFVVGKKVGAPDGATVVFDIEGPLTTTLAIKVIDGRARKVDEVAEPDVRLTMGFEALSRIACGRWDPSESIDRGDVKIDGDAVLGRRIVENMNVMI